MKASGAALAALLIFSSSSRAEQDASRIVAAVDAEYDRVFVTRDAQQLTSFYTDDAVILSPAATAVKGSDNILTFWLLGLKRNWTAHKFEVVSATYLNENTIFATAHWSADLQDATGKETEFHGDTGQIFVRTGDNWKIKFVGWNLLQSK